MIQLPIILDGVKLNKDGSGTLKLETRELTPEEFRDIATLCNKECWCGLSEVFINKLDIPDEIVEFKGEKSVSERLRNTLYVYWNKVEKDKVKNPFENFRKIKMEQFIQLVKEKIPDEER